VDSGKWEQSLRFQAHTSLVRSLATITTEVVDAVAPSLRVASSSDDGLVKIWKVDGKDATCVSTVRGVPVDDKNRPEKLKFRNSSNHLCVYALSSSDSQTRQKFAVARRDGSVSFLQSDATAPGTEESWSFDTSAPLFGTETDGLVLVHVSGGMCAVARSGVIEVWQWGSDTCLQQDDSDGNDEAPSNKKDTSSDANDSDLAKATVTDPSQQGSVVTDMPKSNATADSGSAGDCEAASVNQNEHSKAKIAAKWSQLCIMQSGACIKASVPFVRYALATVSQGYSRMCIVYCALWCMIMHYILHDIQHKVYVVLLLSCGCVLYAQKTYPRL
jgi:hypothetical protein